MRQTILRDLLTKYPNAPARTLAQRAVRENPGVWAGVESCRVAIRRLVGADGKESSKDPTFHRPKRKSTDDWRQYLPDADPTFTLPWGPVQIDGPLKALILSDIHYPFHDKPSLQVGIEYGIEHGATHVLLNGDCMDHYQISRWQKDPRKRHFPQEVRGGRQLLKSIRTAFPKAEIIYKKGNHDERYDAFMQMRCPELIGVPEFEWGNIFGLDELGISLVGDKRPIRLGKLNVLHGHEFGNGATTDPVNPARSMFLRGKNHILCGHFHRTSQHSEKNLEGEVISTWSTGCLADLTPEYRPINPYNAGFAWVEVDSDGAFVVGNLRIIHGKVY